MQRISKNHTTTDLGLRNSARGREAVQYVAEKRESEQTGFGRGNRSYRRIIMIKQSNKQRKEGSDK
jgi:hypothetical protein